MEDANFTSDDYKINKSTRLKQQLKRIGVALGHLVIGCLKMLVDGLDYHLKEEKKRRSNPYYDRIDPHKKDKNPYSL